jgi:glycosyltransferase involved in cell wall biosynthesis
MLFYKLQGKKIVFTAHNVNAGKRDANDSALNRLTLRIQYHLADRIFVHTEKMRSELLADFGVPAPSITVIPFGINNAVPHTALSREQARQRLGVAKEEKAILFFGRIGPYKGLEYLVEAFEQILAKDDAYRLLIVGKPKGGAKKYLEGIQKKISLHIKPGRVVQRIEFVSDQDTELYFKAADVLILPYTEVCQSGVLLLSYSFGLPVIATDVGSMREGIVEGKTGLLCQPGDTVNLARTIEAYFSGDLYAQLDQRRQEIRDYAHLQNSWDLVGDMTIAVYSDLLGGPRS